MGSRIIGKKFYNFSIASEYNNSDSLASLRAQYRKTYKACGLYHRLLFLHQLQAYNKGSDTIFTLYINFPFVVIDNSFSNG